MPLGCIILAAGEGKRMKSRLAKPLHRVSGRTMIDHVLAYCRGLDPDRIAVVLGVGREAMTEALAGEGVQLAIQTEQLGTGHAVMAATEAFAGFDGDLLVTCADIPLVRPETLQALLELHRRQGAAATVLTATYDDPTGYGRIVRDAGGLVRAIVEHRDADEEQLAIREINTAVYCFRAHDLFTSLTRLRPDNAQGEYYLTDVVASLVAEGLPVAALTVADPREVMGINNRVQLAEAEGYARQRVREALMLGGVTLIDPAATYVDTGVTIGQDTILWPGCVITGDTVIGEGCVVGPHAAIESCVIGDRCQILQGSVLAGSVLCADVSAGPYCRIRPDCRIGEGARLGNFAELVRTEVGAGVKDLHCSYLGDAVVGPGSNIGAGAITCNYDGRAKHRTTIGSDAFVGSDTVLVAPLTIGDGAFVAAGSVITDDVPAEALGLGRARQRNVADWARRRREEQQAGE